MSKFITRTPLSNLRPLGTDAERSYERIVAVITQHTDAEHAALLAEPVPARDGSAIDWYAESEGDIVRLSDLDAGHQAEVNALLEQQVGDILAAADAAEEKRAQKSVVSSLRHAMTFPENDALWAVRSGERWLPLIVGWGYVEHDTVTATPFRVTAYGRGHGGSAQRSASDPAATSQGIAHSGRTSAGPSPASGGAFAIDQVETHRRSGPLGFWLWPLLLAIAALILALLIAAFLLPACGIRTPFGTIAFGLPSPACEIGVDQDLAATTGRADELRRELAVLEDQYRRERLQCLIPPEPLVQPDPEEEALVPPLVEPGPPMDRVEQRGNVQVTLEWDTTDDLDLQLICPSGRTISFSQKQGCGGLLDIDANYPRSSANQQPAENITFENGPAEPGLYDIRVNLYRGQPGQSVPFRLKVRQGDSEEIYSGVAGPGNPIPVTEFLIPPGQ